MALTRIAGYGHVALEYGLEESIFLESIMYWWRSNKANNRNFREGRYWTYNTIKALAEIFPWWSAKQVRRIADSCRDKGALIVGNFNADGRDRTIWYSPSNALLALYGEDPVELPASEPPTEGEKQGESNCPNGQMHLPEMANAIAQMGEALPCSYHGATSIPPYSPPEGDGAGVSPESSPGETPGDDPKLTQEIWFDAFWRVYPRKDKRQYAWKAWKKLKPDLALCKKMAAGLKAAKQSHQWTKDGGQYIPLASTWLNGREWENEGIDHSQIRVEQGESPGGWAPDPEVTS